MFLGISKLGDILRRVVRSVVQERELFDKGADIEHLDPARCRHGGQYGILGEQHPVTERKRERLGVRLAEFEPGLKSERIGM